MTLQFHAATYDNQTFECLDLPVGTGPATYTHTADMLLPDHEGLYHAIAAALAPWHGSRVVTNQVPESESETGWTNTGSRFTVVSGISDPDGGNNARRLTINDLSSEASYYYNTGTGVLGEDVRNTIWLRTSTGLSGQIEFRTGAGGGSVQITVTGTWQRFSSLLLDGSAVQRRIGVGANSVAGVLVGEDIEMYAPQQEFVTGQTNQNPSEYVPTAGAAATKHFANLNGNTVASNVVTEAAGALLDPLPSLYAAPALTNETIQSDNFTDAAWVANGVSVTEDIIGLDGTPNGGATVAATSGTGNELGPLTQPPNVSNEIITGRAFIRKSASTSVHTLMQPVQNRYAEFNPQTGAVIGTTAATYDFVDHGDILEILVEADLSDGIGVTSDIFPDRSGDNNKAIGLLLMEIHRGKTIAEVRGSAPIVTAGAPVTNVYVDTQYPISNWTARTNGVAYIDWTPVGDNPNNTGLWYHTSSNTYAILPTANNGRANARYNAVGDVLSTVLGGGTDLQVPYEERGNGVAFHDAAGDIKVKSEGAGNTDGVAADFKNMVAATATFHLSRNGTNVSQVWLTRNVRIYDTFADFAAAEQQLDDLLAGTDGGFPEAPVVVPSVNRPDAKNVALGGPGNTDDLEQAFLDANS